MPLPTVNLDDRRFDDIVAQARQLIPQYCPEWTDHNTSDPGIALLEIFAWMTDLLLFRVNQVPEKMFIKFLDLIGVQLDPPRAAVAPVTFYLAAAPSEPLTIAAATEVATIRTEVTEATVFSTEADLTIYPPHLKAAFTGNALGEQIPVAHDLERLGVLGHKIAVFSPEPVPGDAFYLCLERDHSAHVLSLALACEVAGGAGVDPKEPPFVWEVWQGSLSRWATCTVEYDGTLAFNISGEVILRLPAMAEEEFFGETGHWLRCRITSEQNYAGYKVSPDIESLRVEARGGTVTARHAVVVKNEVLGRSDGMVQVAGHNVSPDAVARRIMAHADVADAHALPDKNDAQLRLKAFVVLQDGLTPDAFELWLHRAFQPFERPYRICYGAQLPRSVSGKPADWD